MFSSRCFTTHTVCTLSSFQIFDNILESSFKILDKILKSFFQIFAKIAKNSLKSSFLQGLLTLRDNVRLEIGGPAHNDPVGLSWETKC